MVFSGIARKALIGTLLTCSAASYSQVNINELMYAPSEGAPEWIELYNKSADSINVKNWKVRNKNARYYTLTDSDFYIPAEGYLVITKSDTIFTFHPSIPCRVIVCPSLPAAFMVNTGDTISLSDSNGAVIDSMFYQPSWGGSGGKSLERISADESSFLGTNWGTCRDSTGCTPGRKNSIAARQNDLKITSFSGSFAASEQICRFKVSIKNSGRQSASGYSIAVFIDNNADHVAQTDELAASLSHPPTIAPGDSSQLTLTAAMSGPHRADILAEVKFDQDEDTSDNFMWARLNVSYAERCIVVNEIMYAPASPMPEWLELYNESHDSVDLCEFTIADNSNTRAVIAHSSWMLGPGEFVVIADDSSLIGIFPQLYGRVLVTKIPSLNNSGDAVVVHDASGILIDSVAYSSSWGGNTGGRSLERILPEGGSNDPQNFDTCVDSTRSTPGSINSVTPRSYDAAVGHIAVFPLSVQSGESATISASILNVGLNPVDNLTVILFDDINADGAFQPGEFVDSAGTAMLTGGDSTTVSMSTGSLSYGTYRFGVFVIFPPDERPANNTGAIVLHVGLASQTVVMNEIMYAPKAPESEWIELYNTGNSTIDLSGFKLVTHGGSSIILTGSLLAPHDFAIICRDSSVSRHQYPLANLILQPVPSLSNNGDGVGLCDNLGNLIDTMSYEPSYGGSNGRSLERVDYFVAGDSTNWHESFDPTGGTPGGENSVAILGYDAAVTRIELPASPVGPSEAANIALLVRNVGRNRLDGVTASLRITNVLTGAPAFSDSRGINQPLLPEDSAHVDFIFVPGQSGTYAILAEVSHQADHRSRNDTLSGLLSVRYQSMNLVVNEIMYTTGATGEYFETFNGTGNDIDLSSWTWHTGQSKPVRFASVPKLLLPAGYFVVCSDSAVLDLVPDAGCVSLSGSLRLRDDGDCIVLSDPSGNTIDSVYYLPSWQNADIAKTSGRSLERINPKLPSNDPTSWSTSVSQTGGTPGARNSLYVTGQNVSGGITVEPNPFSPDGDGHDDFTFISYSFPTSSVKIRARIFDSVGRLLATPFDNTVLPSTGRLVWDGRDGSGRIVRFGLYIILVEVTGPNGNSLMTYKKPLVVAKRMR